MEQKLPTAVALQGTIVAALRVLSVLIGGLTAVAGLVGKRDLSALIAYVQSSDGLAFLGAAIAAASFGWGMWKTYHRERVNANMKVLSPPLAAMAKGKLPDA